MKIPEVAQRIREIANQIRGQCPTQAAELRIPMKPAMHSKLKPAARSDLKPAIVPI